MVYGYPALAAGIARGVNASAKQAAESLLKVQPWNVQFKPGDDHNLARAFEVALSQQTLSHPVEINAQVSLPGGAGLGCSASLGVAVIAALDELSNIDRTPQELAALALEWERVFHGTPSGVDNTMAACGGVARFTKGAPLQPIVVKTPLQLVIGHSGEQSSTKEVVDGVRRLRDRETARVDKVFEAISALVGNGELAIKRGDMKALGQLMDMNQALLSSLMLSTPKLEALCRAAREAGAFGAKLTGAGAGGCMIALVDDESADRVHKAIAELAEESFIVEAGGVV